MNLLDKQINMLAINWAVYKDDTKPEKLQIYWVECLLSNEQCMQMIPSLKIRKFAEEHVCYWFSGVRQRCYRAWNFVNLLNSMLLLTKQCMEIILSLKICEFAKQHACYWSNGVQKWYQTWKAANFLSSMLAIDWAVYGNDIKLENQDFAKQANQHTCYQPSGVWRWYWVWKFANLLNSMLAIDRVMYADNTKPENPQICWEACLLLTQWCLTRMIPSLKIHRFAEQHVYYWSSSVGDDTQLENLWLCWAACLLLTKQCTGVIPSLKICEFAEQRACYWPSSVWERHRVWKVAILLSNMLAIDWVV